MIYYTQFIYVKKGCESTFHTFENQVLPLIKHHNGQLIYRIRPDKSSFIVNQQDLPYEIHLVVFNDKSDFAAYAADPMRQQAMGLKNQSVERILLIEGVAL